MQKFRTTLHRCSNLVHHLHVRGFKAYCGNLYYRPVRGRRSTTITQLRALGVKRMVMLTGNQKIAASVAGGLDDYISSDSPREDGCSMLSFQQEGYTVAMVGDEY